MAGENSDPAPDRDLFGQPASVRQRRRGRPDHKPTRETINRVCLGLARNWTIGEVAQSIGITIPTLKKHYFSELRRRRAMRLMIESVQLGRLNDQAEKGNVAAEKELMKALERGRRESAAVTYAAASPAKPPKLGKKQQRKLAASAPPPRDSSWGDLVEGSGPQVH